MKYSSEQITTLLQAWGHGDTTALEQLLPLVYDELHRPSTKPTCGWPSGSRWPGRIASTLLA
jgi:hypothetical protein